MRYRTVLVLVGLLSVAVLSGCIASTEHEAPVVTSPTPARETTRVGEVSNRCVDAVGEAESYVDIDSVTLVRTESLLTAKFVFLDTIQSMNTVQARVNIRFPETGKQVVLDAYLADGSVYSVYFWDLDLGKSDRISNPAGHLFEASGRTLTFGVPTTLFHVDPIDFEWVAYSQGGGNWGEDCPDANSFEGLWLTAHLPPA